MRSIILFLLLVWPLVASAGEPQLLYRNAPNLSTIDQGRSTACVGTAAAHALQILHPEYEWSAEWIYGQSREQYGATFKYGSKCGWAANCLATNGAVPCANYALLGEDLTTFSAERAMDYGIRGPPDSLLPIAHRYVTGGYTKVKSVAQLRAELSRGHPVIVGSRASFGRGPEQVRNSEGELRALIFGSWNHAMVYIGCDDNGFLVLNSWGSDWISGPLRYGDEPAGSFWVTDWSASSMLAAGDTYSIHPIPGL